MCLALPIATVLSSPNSVPPQKDLMKTKEALYRLAANVRQLPDRLVHSAARIASFPVSPPQLFFAHNKIRAGEWRLGTRLQPGHLRHKLLFSSLI